MFDLFEKYLDEIENDEKETVSSCTHQPFKNVDSYICSICNIDIPIPQQEITYKKQSSIGIRKEIEFLNLNREIVEIANTLFIQACGTKIHRGKFRKSIICACIFHAFLIRKCPHNFDVIIKWFDLTNHTANKGFNLVKLKIPEIQYLHEDYIEAGNTILKQLNVESTTEFISFLENPEIKQYIESKSSRRLYVVLSVLIYIFLKKYNNDLKLVDFSQKFGYSQTTLTKIYKSLLLECPSLV